MKKINTLQELLKNSVEKYRERTAFSYVDETGKQKSITYFEFYYEVKSFVQILNLLEMGNSKVGLICENRYEWCISYLATVISGKQIYPFDKKLKKEELENYLIDSQVSILIFSDKTKKMVEEIFTTRKTKIRYLINIDKKVSDAKILSYQQLLEKGRYLQNYSTEEQKKEPSKQASIILYTSGTIGLPKAVMLSQENICFNLLQIQKRVPISYKDRFLSILPLHHTYECTLGFLFPLCKGATICFSKGYKYFYQEIKKFSPTIIMGVPIIYEKMDQIISKQIANKKSNNKQKKKIKELLGGKIRMLFTGAAPIDPEIVKRFKKRKLAFYQIYGMTECSPVISIEGPYHHKIGSVGKVVYGGKCKIDSPNEKKVGEILYTGKNVMLRLSKQ